ncbi:MAG: DUF4340 domain-containing protein [Opitutales bacterium]
MRLHFTIALLILNVAVFAIIFMIDSRGGEEGNFENQPTVVLGSFIKDLDTLEVTLRIPGEPEQNRVFKRSGERWDLSQPVNWPANDLAIDSILNELTGLDVRAAYRVDEIEDFGKSLGSYGLDDPIVELTYARGEKSGTIRMSNQNFVGDNVHLLSPDGERILVVDRGLMDSLTVDLNELREQRVFRIEPFQTQGLAIEVNPSGEGVTEAPQRVRIEKDEENWRFKAPFDAPADSLQLGPIVTQLTGMRAQRFVDNPQPSETGLDQPFMRVSLVAERDLAQSLLIGAPDTASEAPAFFAKLSSNDTVFTVDGRIPALLSNPRENLRERSFLRFRPDALDAITVKRGNGEVMLQKLETGRWVVLINTSDSSGSPVPADMEVVRDLIRSFAVLEAQAFASDTPGEDVARFGLDEPRASVTLEADQTQTLLLSSPAGQVLPLYAKLAAEPFVYEVVAEILNRLSVSYLHYRDRTLKQLPASAQVRSIQLKDASTDAVLIDRSIDPQSQTWVTLLENEPKRLRDSILELVETVEELRVKEYLRDGFSDSFEMSDGQILPWSFVLEAEVLLPGGDTDQVETIRYYFSKRLSGQVQVGGSPDPGMIFTLPQELIEALFVLTFGRQPLPEPPVMAPRSEPATPPAAEPSLMTP